MLGFKPTSVSETVFRIPNVSVDLWRSLVPLDKSFRLSVFLNLMVLTFSTHPYDQHDQDYRVLFIFHLTSN